MMKTHLDRDPGVVEQKAWHIDPIQFGSRPVPCPWVATIVRNSRQEALTLKAQTGPIGILPWFVVLGFFVGGFLIGVMLCFVLVIARDYDEFFGSLVVGSNDHPLLIPAAGIGVAFGCIKAYFTVSRSGHAVIGAPVSGRLAYELYRGRSATPRFRIEDDVSLWALALHPISHHRVLGSSFTNWLKPFPSGLQESPNAYLLALHWRGKRIPIACLEARERVEQYLAACPSWVRALARIDGVPLMLLGRGQVMSRRYRRQLRGLCPVCGYENNKITGYVCPECGTRV